MNSKYKITKFTKDKLENIEDLILDDIKKSISIFKKSISRRSNRTSKNSKYSLKTTNY